MSLVIKKLVPLADKNWFRTGGPAEFFAEPATPQEFTQALAFSRESSLAVTVLGAGANLLISDHGLRGLVIRPALTDVTQARVDSAVLVTAGAGVQMHDLILYCLDHDIGGLEEFSGIPGTVGGSVFINVHYFQFLLSHFLESATLINAHTGELMTVPGSWFNFGYNYSTLHSHDHYLVNATFKLTPCTGQETAYARGRRAEIIRHRASRYPQSGTCGSFFRNFYDAEVTLESVGKKLIFVAYYLDKIGAKGTLTFGDAIVSYQHANMLVNRGNATSHDIVSLARIMQETVYQQFGIVPQPECRLLGFTEYPLLTPQTPLS